MFDKHQMEFHCTLHCRSATPRRRTRFDSIQTVIENECIGSAYQCTLFKSIASTAFKCDYETISNNNKSTLTKFTIASSMQDIEGNYSDRFSTKGGNHENHIVINFKITRLAEYSGVDIDTLTIIDDAAENLLNNPAKFYQQWGSHFLSDEAKGDSFYIILTIKLAQTDNLQQTEAKLKADFQDVTFESGLCEAIIESRRNFCTQIHFEQTGGPSPGVDTDNFDSFWTWLSSQWIPFVDTKPSTRYGYFDAYWTLPDIANELKTAVYDDMFRVHTLIDAVTDFDECSERLKFIVFDHHNSRFPRMPKNFFGTTDDEISAIKTYLSEIAISRAAVMTVLKSNLLNHPGFNELFTQNNLIARRPEAYLEIIRQLNLKARYPIAPGEDIYLRLGNAYIGISANKTDAIMTRSAKADKLNLIHNNRFLLNNNTVYIQSTSVKADVENNALGNPNDHQLSYAEIGLTDAQEWRIVCDGDFIRPQQALQIWNTYNEHSLVPTLSDLNTSCHATLWTIERP